MNQVLNQHKQNVENTKTFSMCATYFELSTLNNKPTYSPQNKSGKMLKQKQLLNNIK